MALAEAGYPDVDVDCVDGRLGVPGIIPAEVTWRAWAVTGEALMCWPCWSSEATPDDCTHDPLTSPWPGVIR